MAEDNRGTLGAAAEPAAAADQVRQAPPDPATETAAPPPDGGQGPDDGRYIEDGYIFDGQLSPNKGVMAEERRKDFTPAQNAIIDAVYEFMLSLFRELFSTSEVIEDEQGNYRITWPHEDEAKTAEEEERQTARILKQSETDNAKKKAVIEQFNLAEPESTSIFDIFRKFVPVQNSEEEIKNITEAAFLRAMQEVGEAVEAAKAAQQGPPPHLNSKPANKHKMPNDPLTNALAGRYNPKTGEIEKVINAGAFDLPIGRDGKITAYTQVDMDGLTIDAGSEFGPFDESVLNAICSLYEAGNNAITAKMVCRHLRNAFKSEYVEPEFEQSVKNSIEKLRRIHAKSNFSEILHGKTDLDGNPIKIKSYDDFLITARTGLVEAGGQTTECYFLPIEPLPLTVSKQTHQLITVGVKVLDIRRVESNDILGKPLKVTSRRRQIVEYMTRRIEVLKNDRKNKRNKQSDIIAFDAICRESGADDGYTETGTIKDGKGKIVQRGKKQSNQKKYRQDIRNYVFSVLDYWKAIGYIADYEIVYDRRKMHGIRIILTGNGKV